MSKICNFLVLLTLFGRLLATGNFTVADSFCLVEKINREFIITEEDLLNNNFNERLEE